VGSSDPDRLHAAVREARDDAAPFALAAAVILLGLALVSLHAHWELLGHRLWWIWLLLAAPYVLLSATLLFVLGRYSAGQRSDPSDLLPFLQAWADGGALTANVPWAMCAFGPREAECALTAALLGGHARLGFENNMALPDGSTAPDNAALVTNLRRHLDALHRPLASAAELRRWFGR